jgi:hypothetical protein
MTERTGDAPGDEGGDHAVTGPDAGTVRGTRDHAGRPREGRAPHDGDATEAAARELDAENESEPTRSE